MKKEVYTGIWLDIATMYQKQGLSEAEIAKRILCKTTKLLDKQKSQDECDHNLEVEDKP